MKSMSKIMSCDVTKCAYNTNNQCHTPAITVGGPGHQCPQCDTFTDSGEKGGAREVTGGVGACKVTACDYNEKLECGADSIRVGKHEGHPDCMTFEPKQV